MLTSFFLTLVYINKKGYNIDVSELFIVATPIGNLKDITFRAVETLEAVDCVAAEDTRRTLQLLTHFNIRKPLISCRAQNEEKAAERIIGLLNEGKTVAFASDAGTPGISDPGAVLVSRVRAAGYRIVPIPGVSAFATLVSIAGEGGKTIVFEGFLPVKPGKRKSRVLELLETRNAVVLYESPFRIVKLLAEIADIDSERRILVGRELTKMHEEIVEGTAKEVYSEFASRTKILGEFAVFIAGEKKLKLGKEMPKKERRRKE